jgi:hypothetical protein
MGFALWIDRFNQVAWSQGTHEYRPMGTAVVALTDQFRVKDFRQTRALPTELHPHFSGFFGSLEEVNQHLRRPVDWRERATPAHLRQPARK